MFALVSLQSKICRLVGRLYGPAAIEWELTEHYKIISQKVDQHTEVGVCYEKEETFDSR